MYLKCLLIHLFLMFLLLKYLMCLLNQMCQLIRMFQNYH